MGAYVILSKNEITKMEDMKTRNTKALSLFSLVALAGCQSTTQQVSQDVRTRTAESNLMQYSRYTVYGFTQNEPLNFELPLKDVVNCPLSLWGKSILDNKTGTLTISRIEKQKDSSTGEGVMYGYVTSDQYDVSKCTATVEFKERKNYQAEYSLSYLNVVVPKIKELRDEALILEKQQKVEVQKQERAVLDAQYNAQWHIRELSDTAQGIATIKVCMEKGTFFLPGDKRTQKVLRESESYARNDIKSKVNGKRYWDQKAYNQAHQKGLNKARYLWQHDYLTFSNQCAAMRKTVDSLVNQ